MCGYADVQMTCIAARLIKVQASNLHICIYANLHIR